MSPVFDKAKLKFFDALAFFDILEEKYFKGAFLTFVRPFFSHFDLCKNFLRPAVSSVARGVAMGHLHPSTSTGWQQIELSFGL